jgi:hypothetical protein
MSPTIKEIKSKRKQLEASISEAINAFHRDTGCTVAGIELQYQITDGDTIPFNTQVTIRITVE